MSQLNCGETPSSSTRSTHPWSSEPRHLETCRGNVSADATVGVKWRYLRWNRLGYGNNAILEALVHLR